MILRLPVEVRVVRVRIRLSTRKDAARREEIGKGPESCVSKSPICRSVKAARALPF